VRGLLLFVLFFALSLRIAAFAILAGGSKKLAVPASKENRDWNSSILSVPKKT